MKKTAYALLPVLALAAAAPALAADLKNNDDVAYEVYVETSELEQTVTIGANETLGDLCHDCYVEIVDTGSALTIGEEEHVTITDGQLSAE
ncbi:hypothetical protein [Emcibacter nanhaiensis]|uniref:Uncharacterized protein n=1 Tax=Emcibacter nanhaiensis TaxID=1505037 RepID=A0A501PHT3_9PROT|nr:hypothetical protein [Emcibacter nanhaiensis]TPD59396.1 hypothetical protein FIV46_11420 [Emcibacter nanhaiensis]